jgi:peptidoglycan-associated lipoprotein
MRRTAPQIILAGAAVLTLTACHHRTAPIVTAPTTPPPAERALSPVARPPAATVATAARPSTPPLTEDEIFRRKTLDQLNGEHPLGDVFFAYDQSELDANARAVLQRDAQWLSKWPQTRLSVDGHCDERGTEEYNLALGERRAEVVRAYLVNLGVPATRLATRSFGKDAPFCEDSRGGESCWSQNRRDHFLITAK